jgi:hypothetical protein
MTAPSFPGPAVWDGKILTRRKSENHGGPRRFFMALRANYSSSVALRGSPFFLRVKTFGMPRAGKANGVLS